MNHQRRKTKKGKRIPSSTPGNFGIVAKRSLGQHFLTNPRVVEKMVRAATLERGTTVLEIGPGTGMLTKGLLDADARVIALEADERAIDVLRERFREALVSGQLILHHTDVRDVAPTSFIPSDTSYAVVANIPYYLSGMLLRTTLESKRQPQSIVFLVQKEVAERIVHGNKKGKGKNIQGTRQFRHRDKESLLSLSVKTYGTPRYIATVSRGNFTPPPKVDSAILAIDDISRDRFKKLDEKWFFTVLHAGFSSRRKQLLGNLITLRTKKELAERFTALGIPLTVRGEDLSIDTWCTLALSLQCE